MWVSIEKSCGNIKSVNICNHRTVRRWLCDILDLKQIINRGVGKISAQPHTIVKQICFPNCNVLFLSLFSLSKNRMHNVVMGCAEILPRTCKDKESQTKGGGVPINTKPEVEKLANRGMGRSMSYLSTISEPLIQSNR